MYDVNPNVKHDIRNNWWLQPYFFYTIRSTNTKGSRGYEYDYTKRCGFIIFVIFIFPLYWMVVTALKTQVEIFEIPTPLWPRNLSLDAFKAQLSASSDTTLCGFKNSTIIAVGATIISTVLSIPASYGLARFRFRAKKSYDSVLPDHTDASIHFGADILIYYVLKNRTVKYILGTNPGRCHTWYSFQYYHSENLFPVHPEGTG